MHAWGATSAANAFTALPNPGPSPGFVARFDVDPATHTVHFALDGADEQAHLAIVPPDRWKTTTDGPEVTTVYYVRRR